MAVALVGSRGAASQGAASASVTPAYGQSPTAGNLLVLTVSIQVVATLPATPAGWGIAAQVAGTSCSSTIFYKTATGGDAQPTITGISTAVIAAQLSEYSGVIASLIDRSGTSTGTTSPNTATAGGANAATGELIIMCGSDRRSVARASNDTWTSNDGTVTLAGSNNGTSSQNHYSFGAIVGSTATTAQTSILTLSITTSITGIANVNASFKLGVTDVNTLTANAVIKHPDTTPASQPTADAVIKHPDTTSSLTANAVSRVNRSGSLTANSVIKHPDTTPASQPTANAVAKRTGQAGSAAANAVSRIGWSGSLTANSVIKATMTESPGGIPTVKAGILTYAGQNPSPTVPSHSAGDLLVLVAAWYCGASPTSYAGPSGWSQVLYLYDPPDQKQVAVWTKIAQSSSETASYTGGLGGQQTASHVWVLSGASVVGSPAIARDPDLGDAQYTVPGITLTTSGAQILSLVAIAGDRGLVALSGTDQFLGGDNHSWAPDTDLLTMWDTFSGSNPASATGQIQNGAGRESVGGRVAFEAPPILFAVTADAVIKRTQLPTAITSNAVLWRNQTPTLTADAIRLRTYIAGTWVEGGWVDPNLVEAGGVSADAVLGAGATVRSGSFTANAVIKGARSGSLAADAIRLRTFKFGKAGQ
jgi:hypothetical protein